MKTEVSDVESQKISKSSSLEEALISVGYGKFHWKITSVCGLGFIAAGLQYGLNAYLIPAASCDLNMDSSRMGLLNSVFLAGSVCSTYLWGLFADLFGRKGVLVWTLFLDGIFTLASSFSQQFELFCFFRFCAGFLVASPSSLLFAYLGEFHTMKDSPRSICILGFFFTLSWLLLPGICWLILPIRWAYHSPDGNFTFNSWRILVALLSLPQLISSALLAFQPETPKYLFSQGMIKEAENVLEKMQSMNLGSQANKLPMLKLEIPKKESLASVSSENGKSFKRLLLAMWSQAKSLFMPPHLTITALFSLLIFANMFGYFGLGLWLPELFNRLDHHYKIHPNVTVTVCELSKMVENSRTPQNPSCMGETISPQVFQNTLLMGAVCLLGNLLSVILSKRLEYRVLPVGTMLSGGCCVLAIYLLRSPAGNLIASSLFQASIATANYSITSVILDLFPTHIRAVGLCMGLLSGRISSVAANMLLGQLLEVNCHLLFLLIIGVISFGGILCLFIPKNSAKT